MTSFKNKSRDQVSVHFRRHRGYIPIFPNSHYTLASDTHLDLAPGRKLQRDAWVRTDTTFNVSGTFLRAYREQSARADPKLTRASIDYLRAKAGLMSLSKLNKRTLQTSLSAPVRSKSVSLSAMFPHSPCLESDSLNGDRKSHLLKVNSSPRTLEYSSSFSVTG